MLRWPVLFLLAVLAPLQPPRLIDGPAYTASGELKFPAAYPEWIFLGTGLDMSYNTTGADPDMHVFNSVFVNPDAWKMFKSSGVWPEGTMLVLENRGAGSDVSINKHGRTQTAELMGLEVHVKDSERAKGGWAFYSGFEDKLSGKLIPRPASCYTCHQQHGASDTTFVQFYPHAFTIAHDRKTLAAAFQSLPAK